MDGYGKYLFGQYVGNRTTNPERTTQMKNLRILALALASVAMLAACSGTGSDTAASDAASAAGDAASSAASAQAVASDAAGAASEAADSASDAASVAASES